jgi:hypothetical protein
MIGVDKPVLADVAVQAAHAENLLPIYTSGKPLSFKGEG